ncbi:hypothetical protein [Lusitaniella coriacea]|uniref:hypothetical protein n=1 Tax=Lusitaniella coriacea TaxID=1983105 RepID=UPI003CF00A69
MALAIEPLGLKAAWGMDEEMEHLPTESLAPAFMTGPKLSDELVAAKATNRPLEQSLAAALAAVPALGDELVAAKSTNLPLEQSLAATLASVPALRDELVGTRASNNLSPHHSLAAAFAPKLGDREWFDDGIYLYGQTQQPNQLGQVYLTFAVTQGAVVGAFYMPQSSFDCTYGEPKNQTLALTVVDSYSQDTSTFEIAIARTALVAAGNNNSTETQIELDGFHQIENVSESDRNIVNQCEEILL